MTYIPPVQPDGLTVDYVRYRPIISNGIIYLDIHRNGELEEVMYLGPVWEAEKRGLEQSKKSRKGY